MSTRSRSSAPGAPAPRSPRGCASRRPLGENGELRLLCVPTVRSPRSPARSSQARGSHTCPARRRSAALEPHRGGSRCTRCRRSRGRRAGAARRRLGRRHRRVGGGAGARALARRDARPHPFKLADDAARLPRRWSIASNFLVTLYRAPPTWSSGPARREALVPLMDRTIENGFELTGPIARGDWSTVERHRGVAARHRATRGPTRRSRRRRGRDRRALDRRARPAAARRRRPRPDDGRVARRPRRAFAAARAGMRRARRERLRQPRAVLGARRPRRVSTRFDARWRAAEQASTSSSRPSAAEMYPPASRRGRAGRRGRRARGAHRPGHFRGVATVCLKLFNIVRPQIAWFGQKDAQQVAVVKQLVRDLNVPVEIRVVETARDARRPRVLVAQRDGCRPRSASAHARFRARSKHATRRGTRRARSSRPRARLRRRRRPRRPHPRSSPPASARRD